MENTLKVTVTDRTRRAKTHVDNSGQTHASSHWGGRRVHNLLGKWTRTLSPWHDTKLSANTHTRASAEQRLMTSQLRPFRTQVCLIASVFLWFVKGKLWLENMRDKEKKGNQEGTKREREKARERGKKQMATKASTQNQDCGLPYSRVPNFSGTRYQFCGRPLFHGPGVGDGFKHIIFILYFITITSDPPQIIRHLIPEVEDSCPTEPTLHQSAMNFP